jgi:hypothetical protein
MPNLLLALHKSRPSHDFEVAAEELPVLSDGK